LGKERDFVREVIEKPLYCAATKRRRNLGRWLPNFGWNSADGRCDDMRWPLHVGHLSAFARNFFEVGFSIHRFGNDRETTSDIGFLYDQHSIIAVLYNNEYEMLVTSFEHPPELHP